MSLKFALVGNPNSGKTTLFNSLTGSNQYVGNWPGVTVEKKEGRIKGQDNITLVDLPGIYSLSPYTPEEVVSRNFLLEEQPDCIINIVDGSNLERNLYLTTQLLETALPIVIAVNMMDIIRKNGDTLDLKALGKRLGTPVLPVSALRSQGLAELVREAESLAGTGGQLPLPARFDAGMENALNAIEAMLPSQTRPETRRYYAIKLFERDREITGHLCALPDQDKLETIIVVQEALHDDDAESIITNERYHYVGRLLDGIYRRAADGRLTMSDKIDKVVTNRWLALPIFVGVMFFIYFLAISTIGTWLTDWANDGVFGEGWHVLGRESWFVPGIPSLAEGLLLRLGTADWLNSLVLDGIVAGVGAVLGFIPQIAVLFFLLALLEDCGYMSRIAFIMDRIFRRVGLSGKSFIPMLVATGCGVPGVLATRTIESERDRRMTIITTTFMPCGAKLPVIALIAGALYGGAWWVAPTAYFIGITAIIVSGIALKKTKRFQGDPAPFVMELPAYHLPQMRNVLRRIGERCADYASRAASVIMVSSVVLWFLMNFGFTGSSFGMVENVNNGLLARIGSSFAFIFRPLGFGHWQAAVASITGLIAKENIVGTLGVVHGFGEVSETGTEIWGSLALSFSAFRGFSFLLFNLLCAPCFAAMAAIRREMNDGRWTAFAIGYMCGLAYAVSLVFYQMATWIAGGSFTVWTAAALVLLATGFWFLFRPLPKEKLPQTAAAAAQKI